MAGSRTLKLSILADVDDLKKKLDTANGEVETFGSKLGDFGKAAGVAFAAAGVAAAAYASKLLVDGVKAAIEDEAAQAKLATTLTNVTGATNTQIKAVEDYITKTSLAKGVTDDELRPSLDRLLRSTKDVDEAQKLQNLALDIAAGTGKDLASVSEALAKAHDGNFTALKKLGVTLDESVIKSKDFDAAQAALAQTFANQSTIQAETFEGKMARLNIAFNEAKETVGSYVLDALTPLLTTVVNNVIPTLSTLASNIGDKLQPVFESLSTFFTETLIPAFEAIWAFIQDYVIPILQDTLVPVVEALFDAWKNVADSVAKNSSGFKAFLKDIAPLITFIKDKLAPAVGTILVTAIKAASTAASALFKGFDAVAGAISDVISGIKALIKIVADNPLVKGISNVIKSVFGGGKASGGFVNAGTSYLVGEKGAELFTPQVAGKITPLNAIGGGSSNTTINITVNGAIDKEGVARQIVELLNNSFYRGTIGAGGFAT